MQLSLDRSTLEKLRDHAAFAAHLISHLDDNDTHPGLVGQLSEHIDTIAHELAELLGIPARSPSLMLPHLTIARRATARRCSRPSREVRREPLTRAADPRRTTTAATT
jgi:hypothetical protein